MEAGARAGQRESAAEARSASQIAYLGDWRVVVSAAKVLAALASTWPRQRRQQHSGSSAPAPCRPGVGWASGEDGIPSPPNQNEPASQFDVDTRIQPAPCRGAALRAAVDALEALLATLATPPPSALKAFMLVKMISCCFHSAACQTSCSRAVVAAAHETAVRRNARLPS